MDEYIPWLFSGVGVVIAGWLWRIFTNRKYDPEIRLKGAKGNVFEIQVPQRVDSDALIQKAVDAEVKQLPKYNPGSADPYINMWNVVSEVAPQLKNQRHYMELRNQYIDSFHAYQYDIITSQIADEKMIPIKLNLFNVGRKSGEHIEVELSFKGMLYDEHNKNEKKSHKHIRPLDIGNNTKIIYSQLETEEYSYVEWDLKSPLSSPLSYRLERMNAQSNCESLIPVLYVNAEDKTDVEIHWKINEISFTAPKEGDIFIRKVEFR
jgi:hypothetical protein